MIPYRLFGALRCGARAAVADAVGSAWSKRTPPDEVDHIYAMTTEGVDKIAKYWSRILEQENISLRVTGVFCHQTPKATYIHQNGSKKTCELGDLLIVHEDTTKYSGNSSNINRRAVLIQAKMVYQGMPKKVDECQEYLYQEWPDFELKGQKNKFLSGSRNFRSCSNPGRYGLIERQGPSFAHFRSDFPLFCSDFPLFCSDFSWVYSKPRQPVVSAGGEDAGTFIANMLYDTDPLRGRAASIPSVPHSLQNNPNNHFDVTVQELLEVTGKKNLIIQADMI